ncbi:uncharacterized protein DDB_G0283697-like [Homalodisca vitripennis]|uniref:uncharacterized protein DDB_G0283697-like n=1 Tax=Homalodisca vitripennis TaxID=197043 RepID=UPI001EEB5443|nr:uncharacterized protein DDB_G0283697-like [Homalodisca vitripennis]
MKLKTSLGLDSSGESDTGFEPLRDEKDKELKKKHKYNRENSSKDKKLKRNEEKGNRIGGSNVEKKKTEESKKGNRSKIDIGKDTSKKITFDESDEEKVEPTLENNTKKVEEEMDCDNIGSSSDENLKGNGIKLEKEPDVGNSNIDNENIDTENASKEYKQLRKRELNKPGLDSSVEESDIKIEREDEVENESNDEKIKNKTNSKGKEKKLKTASVRNQRRSKKSNLLDSSDEDDEPSHEKETNLQHILR